MVGRLAGLAGHPGPVRSTSCLVPGGDGRPGRPRDAHLSRPAATNLRSSGRRCQPICHAAADAVRAQLLRRAASSPARPDANSLSDRLSRPRGPATAASGPAEPRIGNLRRAAHVLFTDDAETAGLRFIFDNGRTSQHLLPETMSGGVALLDYDGDGWLDVYCVQGGSLRAREPGDAKARAEPEGRRPALPQPRRRDFRGCDSDPQRSPRSPAAWDTAWASPSAITITTAILTFSSPGLRPLCPAPQSRRRDLRGCDRARGPRRTPGQPDVGRLCRS